MHNKLEVIWNTTKIFNYNSNIAILEPHEQGTKQ